MEPRDTLNADSDFVLYKTLVGREPVHPDAWEQQGFDPKAKDAWREEQCAAILAGLENDRAPEFIGRMRRYLEAAPNVTDVWPMSNFAGALASTKPEVAIKILDAMDDLLRPTLVNYCSAWTARTAARLRTPMSGNR